MTTRYLVAWAGDRHCADSLRLGAMLARSFDAALDVVYVAHVSSGVARVGRGSLGGRAFEEAVMAEAKQRMAASVADLTGIDVTLHARGASSISSGLLDAVRELGSSLVVMGAGHGAGVPVASSVASSMLHASPVPVALAPRGFADHPHDRVSELVCAVGARPGAQDVLDETLEAVQRSKVPLRLVSLVELTGHDDAGRSEDAKEATRVALVRARQLIGDSSPVTVETPSGRDLREAMAGMSWDPDGIVVVGSSRLATGRQTFLGTMAARMLSHLPVPMIVLPSSGRG